MATAWDVPQNPMADPSLDGSKLGEEIRWGYRLFTNTPAEAARFNGGRMSCGNCHLNAGQRERALPLVGVAAVFPEYNRREGRLFSLEDRIVGCFMRSQNATGHLEMREGASTGNTAELPTTSSREVLALSAYITWLSRDSAMSQSPSWRGQNAIPPEARIPIAALDRRRGEALFLEHCTNCHGEDGQGVAVGDKRPGPLWGPYSWNDGAGAARVYTLAGIIRHMMPYLNPGSLTDDEAQQIAAFITSKPRPSYPYKDEDYLLEPVPPDSVYYPPRAN
jgi:thiosulfate dehydrogenase